MVKTEKEIIAMLDKALEMNDFQGMTYKDGVTAAIEWVLCQMDEGDDPTQ